MLWLLFTTLIINPLISKLLNHITILWVLSQQSLLVKDFKIMVVKAGCNSTTNQAKAIRVNC